MHFAWLSGGYLVKETEMNAPQLLAFIKANARPVAVGGDSFNLVDYVQIRQAAGANAIDVEQLILTDLRTIITQDKVKVVNVYGRFDVREDPTTTRVMVILDVGA